MHNHWSSKFRPNPNLWSRPTFRFRSQNFLGHKELITDQKTISSERKKDCSLAKLFSIAALLVRYGNVKRISNFTRSRVSILFLDYFRLISPFCPLTNEFRHGNGKENCFLEERQKGFQLRIDVDCSLVQSGRDKLRLKSSYSKFSQFTGEM